MLEDQDFIQTDLGEIEVYAENQIKLEDIDPYNIPQDKDIIINASKAKVVAIGRRAESQSSDNVHDKIFIEERKRHGVGLT